ARAEAAQIAPDAPIPLEIVADEDAMQAFFPDGDPTPETPLGAAFLWWSRRGLPDSEWFLRSLVFAAPAGMIAIEAGWTVTEVGRQPWIIYGIMRTSEAVTPMPGLIVPFVTFTLLYLLLGAVVAWLLFRQVAQSPRENETGRLKSSGEVLLDVR
ncbi:MAG: cytochrome ubiquinol oxidase subunit I, partial [Acidobacteriota bacterium]